MAQTSSPFLGLEVLSPEVAAFLQTTQQLPTSSRDREVTHSQRGSFAKSNGGFQRVRLFLEPSHHPNPIKNYLEASESPQASPKVRLTAGAGGGTDKAWFLVILKC